MKRTSIAVIAGGILFSGILGPGPFLGAANAACLPGQTCWQPSQPTVHDLQRQVQQDRAKWLNDQQQVISDRTKEQLPLGNPTPLDRIQQQQNLRQSEDQLRQSQQSLQQSQQSLQDQLRPPLPKP